MAAASVPVGKAVKDVPTLAASVTSAEASMPSSFVPSVCKSLPSTVPPRVILFPIATLLLASSITALDAGSVQNTSFVPAPKSTALSLLELLIIEVLDIVEEATDNPRNCSARVLGSKRRCENS